MSLSAGYAPESIVIEMIMRKSDNCQRGKNFNKDSKRIEDALKI